MARRLLLLLAFLLVSSQAMAAETHYCNCDGAGAVAACVGGDDGTGTGTAALPFKTWNAAGILWENEASFGPLDKIRMCQGGHWPAAAARGWANTSCTAASNCFMTDYVPSWNGESQMPIIEQPVSFGHPLTLATSLTTDNITSVVLSEGCPGDEDGLAVWVEDDGGWWRRLTWSTCIGSTLTITSTNGYEDFATVNATAGNGVSVHSSSTDPIFISMDGNGSESNQTEGYHWSNLEIRGPLNWTTFNTDGGTGFFLFGDRDDMTFDNLKVSGFGNGFNIRFNAQDPEFMQRIYLLNMEMFHNSGAAILGGSLDGRIWDGFFWENADQLQLEHTIYVSRTAHRIHIKGNLILDSNLGTGPGEDCNGAAFITHNSQTDWIVEDNELRQTVPGGSACWGMGFDGGNGSVESFTDFIIRRNTLYGFTNGITMGSAIRPIIEDNLIVIASTTNTARAIRIPNGNGEFDDASIPPLNDPTSTGVIVRNNSILFLAGTRGTAIRVGQEGTNNEIVSNSIDYLGSDGAFNCLRGDGTINLLGAPNTPVAMDIARYSAVANNICNRTVGEWMNGEGNLAAWQAFGSGMGTDSAEDDPEFTDVIGTQISEFDLSSNQAAGTQPMEGAGHLTLSAPNDFLGVARGGSPDAGAYQETAGPAALVAPIWLSNTDSALGMNLSWVRGEDPGIEFINAMKTSGVWQEVTSGGTCGTGGSPYNGTVDSDFYPLSGGFGTDVCIYTELFSGAYADGAWPDGEWTLRWNGDATFAVGGTASGYATTASDRATFSVGTTTGGFWLGIDTLTTSVSNMRLYPPGGVCVVTTGNVVQKGSFCSKANCPGGTCPDAVTCGGGETCVDFETIGEAGDATFHPLWLSRLGQYSLLRFMNWLHTNHSQVVNFSEWNATTHYSYRYGHATGELGVVPLAVIAELCNDVNSACYVNIPTRATDGHITSFVEFFRDNVNSWLPIYLEYSNEVWNSGFQQRPDMAALAFTLGTDFPLEFDGTGCDLTANEFDCASNYAAKRTYEMCGLAQAAFDASGQGSRLHCVEGTRIQANGVELSARLDCARWLGAPNGNCYTGSNVDLIATNMYFGDGTTDCAGTKQAACDAAQVNIDGRLCSGAGCVLTEIDTVLSTRSLTWPTMVYEGGSSLDLDSSASCVAITRDVDSCLIGVYQNALDRWKDLDTTSGLNLERYAMFDNSGSLYSAAPGNLFGHRGSNEGLWPKESSLVQWDQTAGNECWWTDCILATSAPAGSSPPSMIGGGISGGSLSMREQTEMMLEWMGVSYAR